MSAATRQLPTHRPERAEARSDARLPGGDALPALTPRWEAAALGLALVVAALLRLPLLDRVPNGLFLDEASRGYDAYALLRTGADQYGVPWPLFAEGLDDYTPSLYTLLVIPFVAALGLTETAVRLPAALVGVATVGVTFLAGRAFLGSTAGLVGAALVAISPWHVLPSRTGAEWVLLPFFLSLGAWLLGRGRWHGPSLLAAGVVLGIGLYAYAFARLLVPLLVIGYAALFWRDLRPRRSWALAGLVALVLLALPIVAFGLTEAGQARPRTVVPLDRYRGLALLPYALANFASYWGPGFLIWGAEPTHHHRLAGFGPLLPIMVPLLVAALAGTIQAPSRAAGFWLWWLVAAPASAALHRESPSSALLLGAIPAWQVVAGYGAALAGAWICSHRPRLLGALAGALVVGIAATGGLAANALYADYPTYAAGDWLAGSRDTIRYLEAHRAEYDGVLVSDRLPTPHVLVLFFAQIDPATYQRAPLHVRQPNVRSRGEIGAYRFGRIDDLLERPGRYLVWVTPGEARTLFPSSEPAFAATAPDGGTLQLVYSVERR